jgi:assimilatory nitrate reductase catalytic subunit
MLRGDELLEYEDEARGVYRVAVVRGGRLEACLFTAPDDATLPAREWLAGLFARERLDDAARGALLRARAPGLQRDAGPIVCACFQVGRNHIVAAIEGGCASVAAVGQKSRAGTNCGSCKPEIARLLAGRSASSTPESPASAAARAAVS